MANTLPRCDSRAGAAGMTREGPRRICMTGPDDRICVGAIAGAFGVRGEVRLKSFTAEPRAIADYGLLTTEDGRRSFTVTLPRPVTGGFGARLSGIATREEAEALKGVTLWAARAALPSLPD